MPWAYSQVPQVLSPVGSVMFHVAGDENGSRHPAGEGLKSGNPQIAGIEKATLPSSRSVASSSTPP